MKACIAKNTKQFDFPDKKKVNESYTHDIIQLIRTTGLHSEYLNEIERDKKFKVNSRIIEDWNENSRYKVDISKEESKNILDCITNKNNGILKWIKQY